MTQLLSEAEASGKAKQVYEEIRGVFGMVPNFFKAQAAADPEWAELNWLRWKTIMGSQRALDRKTKELIAVAISLSNNCPYCSLAHEAMAMMAGASEREIQEMREVVELFQSFNAIANSLQIPCDVTPDMVRQRN